MDPVNNVTTSANNDMIYIHIIITIGVAIITAIITASVAHIFARRRENSQWNRTLELNKIQEYNRVSDIFRSEFTHALQTLKQEDDGRGIDNILSDFIDNQERALIVFTAYLSDEELKNINTAWIEYACTDNHFPDHKSLIGYNAQEINKKKLVRKLAIQRILTLLECAKPKQFIDIHEIR